MLPPPLYYHFSFFSSPSVHTTLLYHHCMPFSPSHRKDVSFFFLSQCSNSRKAGDGVLLSSSSSWHHTRVNLSHCPPPSSCCSDSINIHICTQCGMKKRRREGLILGCQVPSWRAHKHDSKGQDICWSSKPPLTKMLFI